MTKKPYSPRRCKLHPDSVAAICPECYMEAENQRDRHWAQERQRTHRAYLERRGMTRNLHLQAGPA